MHAVGDLDVTNVKWVLTMSQAGEVDLAMISQTTLATKLRRADNQPLACVLTLHNTSDIYKVCISLIATRQQLAMVHQIESPDGTWYHQARAGQAGGPSQGRPLVFCVVVFFKFFTHPTREYLHVIPKKSRDPKNIDLYLIPPK